MLYGLFSGDNHNTAKTNAQQRFKALEYSEIPVTDKRR